MGIMTRYVRSNRHQNMHRGDTNFVSYVGGIAISVLLPLFGISKSASECVLP